MTTLSTRATAFLDLWFASERASARVDHSLGAIHGIGLVEFMVLWRLMKSTDSRMRRVDLAAAIGRTQSGVTRLLRPMEKTGLVSRDSSDRDARVSLVTITSAGKKRLEESLSTLNELATKVTQPIGDAQMDSLAAALALLRD